VEGCGEVIDVNNKWSKKNVHGFDKAGFLNN
jgi:hypothetical protein